MSHSIENWHSSTRHVSHNDIVLEVRPGILFVVYFLSRMCSAQVHACCLQRLGVVRVDVHLLRISFVLNYWSTGLEIPF